MQAWLADWIALAQNADLSAHTLILEDGLENAIVAIIANSTDHGRGMSLKKCTHWAASR
jgi:hypothetical protein